MILNTRWMLVLFVFALFGLSACGGGSSGSNQNTKKTAYISLLPVDTKILTDNTPDFSFERSINNTSSVVLCNTVKTPSHAAVLKVIKVNASNTGVQTVLEKDIQVQNECKFEITFPSLVLEENVGYAWRVSDPNVIEDEKTKWNSFVYSPRSLGLEDKEPHSCKNNLVRDWSFTERRTQWNTLKLPLGGSSSLASIFPNGHDDIGAGIFQSPNEVLFQHLSQPMVQGKKYQLKFSLKHQGKSDFQIKVLAFNGHLTSLQPSADIALVAVTGTMTHQQNNWIKITLPAWRAINDFQKLAIVAVNPQGRFISAMIDRVCLSEIETSGCAPSVDAATGLPEGFDLENGDPVITQHEYLAGSVNNLYPDYDTSSADWFEQANEDGELDCSSIGGELTDEEEEEIDQEMKDPELDTLFETLKDTTEEMLTNIVDADTDDPDLELSPIINTLSPEKCTKRIVDPSKPFSGRDIVYIHGLQLPALKGNVKVPPTYQEKWPADKSRFYSGGDSIKRAKYYWADHIQRELGAEHTTTFTPPTLPIPVKWPTANETTFTSAPSNSFLVVSWSANQRTRFAIHAVLTQIRDAMARNNQNVVLSQKGREKKQCFGDNGIVVVTHSTGGLIASAMFGIAENSNDPAREITRHGNTINIKNTFGDVRFITEKIDAQVGINAAYGGSPFAEIALKKLTSLALHSILVDLVTKAIIGNLTNTSFGPQHAIIFNRSSLVDLVPKVAAERWREWMLSSIPTLTMSGTFLGKSVFGPNIGKKMIKGFDDLVLSPSSQSNSYVRRPRFEVKNRGKLNDKGVGRSRRRAQIKDGKKKSGIGYRNYYNTPYIAPTGMLQGNSVKSITDPTNVHVGNHHIVLQTTGDHFDNVNNTAMFQSKHGIPKTGPYVNSYGITKGNLRMFPPLLPHSIKDIDETSYEETGVVFGDDDLYNRGLLSNSFKYLNDEWIRDEIWGFHFFKIIWIKKPLIPFKVPKITWHYYEFIKWQRKYHLLHDYKNKIGADYMYEHILR